MGCWVGLSNHARQSDHEAGELLYCNSLACPGRPDRYLELENGQTRKRGCVC